MLGEPREETFKSCYTWPDSKLELLLVCIDVTQPSFDMKLQKAGVGWGSSWREELAMRVEGRKAQALYYDIREVSTWGTGAEIGTLFYSWLCH